MNLTKKKSNICLKKNSRRRFHLKKIFLHKQWAKIKIHASWKFPSPRARHFSGGPSLNLKTLVSQQHSSRQDHRERTILLNMKRVNKGMKRTHSLLLSPAVLTRLYGRENRYLQVLRSTVALNSYLGFSALCQKIFDVRLTNWRQFFMRLSCYWSWISS